MDMQDLIVGMNARAQRERASVQMTLGALIKRLEEMPPDARIDGISSPHSYRGYYCDLAFETGEPSTVAVALQVARDCMGHTFAGYKGGEYDMGARTPVWSASHGSCGQRIMGINDDGSLVLAGDE